VGHFRAGRALVVVLPPRYEIIGIEGLPEIRRGADLAALIVDAAARQGAALASRDMLVVSQKIVSKSEDRVVPLAEVTASAPARALAEEIGRDARLVEVILGESRRIVRKDKGVLIVETHHGFICANAGVDQSNVDAESASLLPEDADRSARALRDGVRGLTGHALAIIVADTFGRPWREGLTNIAVGIAGFEPLKSHLGEYDPAGHVLHATVLALADELAGAAEPVMGKLSRIPVAIIRGLEWEAAEGSVRSLLRDPARDLFR
jgi:coenzyme F420-0:L-glutamate ligase / coenzyme F420-1:gamma-L-glutamate ligase